jgi:hypothetical protein
VYHWSNGLWTAAITWGATISPTAQKRWGVVCLAMGIVLSIFAVGSIGGALAYEPSEKEWSAYNHAIERIERGERYYEHGEVPEEPYVNE